MAIDLGQVHSMTQVHQQDILQWAFDTFKNAFEPSMMQRELLVGWSSLVNAKRKAYWNTLHPEQTYPLSVQEHEIVEKIGMSLQSGHGLAKTATLSLIALHFLQCFPDSRTLVTAPAGPQLFTVIWPELYKWIHCNELTKSLWKWNAKQINPVEVGSGGDHWIRPRTIDPKATAEEMGETLAGLHAAQTCRLVDEASAVPDPVMLPFEGGLTDPLALIAIGFNPTRNVGFAIETQRKYRHRWLCYHMDAEKLRKKHPSWYNPKNQYDLEETYGRDSNFYRVRVRGLPPLAAPDTLFPWEWVMDAKEREPSYLDTDTIILGVDVAGEGADRSVAALRRRDSVLDLKERRGLDTTQVAWWIESIMEELTLSFPDCRIIVGIDSIGIGKGVYDYLRTAKGYRDVWPVNVARKLPPTDRWYTIRDRSYWDLRGKFEHGLMSIPKHDSLLGELTAFKWSDENMEGRIKVEDKRSMRSRLPEGKNSPDNADAVMITEYLIRMYGKRQLIQQHESRRHTFQRLRKPKSWKVL